MRQSPVCVEPPAGDFVPLELLKAQIPVDYDDDDHMIDGFEKAAVAHLDGWSGILGRCIQRQTWQMDFSHWGHLDLPFPDVREVKVMYTDLQGVEQPVKGQIEVLPMPLGGRVVVRGPAAIRVRVQFTCEMAQAGQHVLRQAVMMLVAHWYRNRHTVSDTPMSQVPLAFNALIDPLRIRRV